MPTNQVSERLAGGVRVALARKQISVRRAAQELGHSQSYLARRMNGVVPFTVDEAEEVAQYLGLSVSELLLEQAS